MDSRKKNVLRLESRRILYEEIQVAPGIHFRELQRRTGMAVGSLQYHLDVLTKNRLVRFQKQGKFIRYFPVVWEHKEEDKQALSHMRQEAHRRIVLYLLDRKKATITDLSEFLGLSSSTVSFHLQKMLKDELIQKTRDGRVIYFKLKDPKQARHLIVGYKTSFLDKLVDNFVEIWQQIE